MGVRESLLNTITSVADSDFVRIVTAAGASSKATVRNLFKGFESNLSAKSSLSDSDYIRVVGSDNEAYKQSVASVASAVKATKAVSNLNDATTAGFYSFASGASNSPNTDYSGTLMVIDSVVTTQLASVLDRLYVRRYVNSAWDAWTLIPTRAEVNVLNNNMGNIVYYYKNIGTSYTTLKSRLEALMAYSDFPTEKAICGAFLSGSYHFVAGYLDANKNGGFVVINFAGGGLFRVYAGVATQI